MWMSSMANIYSRTWTRREWTTTKAVDGLEVYNREITEVLSLAVDYCGLDTVHILTITVGICR